MIKQISWANYAYAITILLIIYYIAIVVIYYSKSNFKKVIHKRIGFSGSDFFESSPNSSTSSFSSEPLNSHDHNLYITTQNLIEKLQNLLQYGGEKLNKGVLLREVKTLISGYKKLKGTPFEASINSFLIIECQINCSINLSEEELRELWIGD